MRHPLEAIPSDKRRIVFLPLLAATLVLIIAFGFIGPAQPYNIVDFELAGNVAKSQAMVDAWSPIDRIHAGFSLGIDYLFMPLYSTTIALALVWAASKLRAGPLRSIGLWLAWGLWLAALFDATENVALAVILFNLSAIDPWPQLAAICATIKFGLIAIGLIYLGAALVLQPINRQPLCTS